MPYDVNADLPPSVRSHLPEHAQDMFREAFNQAYAAHAHDPRQEESRVPHRLGGGEAGLREDRGRVGGEEVDGDASARSNAMRLGGAV